MKLIALLTTVAAVALAAPGRRRAPPREYEGTVVSVNRDNRTFRLHDSERGTIRIKVTRSTRFERIAGFGALRARPDRRSRRPCAARTAAGSRSRSSAPAAAAATAATTTDAVRLAAGVPA